MTPNRTERPIAALIVTLATFSLACGAGPEPSGAGSVSAWPHYGGDKGGIRYAAADQITRQNVADLEVAWVHHNGDFSNGEGGYARTSFNATPILVDDTLVFCTPMNRVVAIDAETGADRWAFDPEQRQTKLPDPHTRVCRGVAYWEHEDTRARALPCGRASSPPPSIPSSSPSTRPAGKPAPTSVSAAAWRCAKGIGDAPDLGVLRRPPRRPW